LGLVHDDGEGRVAPGRVHAGTVDGDEVRNDGVTELGTDVVEVLIVPVDFALYGEQPSEVRGGGVVVLIYDRGVDVVDLAHEIQENVQGIVDERSVGSDVEEVREVAHTLVVL